MKERPILFSAPMVRALLDGSKTQTRRVMKTQLVYGEVCGLFASWYLPNKAGTGGTLWPNGKEQILATCPYGQPGDRLWVRESGVRSLLAGKSEKKGLFRHDVPTTPETGHYWVEATRAPGASYSVAGCSRASALLGQGGAKACPSIHMPRWASRILLEIVSVRVERLNDISEADVLAEGVKRDGAGGHFIDGTDARYAAAVGEPAADAFSALWNGINGTGSWDDNPWVWMVEFKRVAP